MNDGYTGGMFCIQSQGALLNYHPHVHALVLTGILKDGIFHEQTKISTSVIAEIFRARLLTVLLEQGVITSEKHSKWMCFAVKNVAGKFTPLEITEMIGDRL